VAAFFAGRPYPPCSPIIYSVRDCLILNMLVDLRKEESVVLLRLLKWGMNHRVNCADIFSQQLRKISDGNATVAPEQKLVALQILHLQNIG